MNLSGITVHLKFEMLRYRFDLATVIKEIVPLVIE